jgi:hypothetical protein
MPTFDFQVVLSDIQEMDERTAEALYAAGCDDGTPFSRQGFAAVGFSRDADTLEDAIRSAISDVNRAGFTVARVESVDESVYVKINRELTRH